MNDVVTLLGGAAGATLLNSVVQIILRRMTRRETEANAGKAEAETQAALMDTWMRTVLAPTERRAEHAEQAAAAAAATAERVSLRLDAVERVIRAHEPWDRQAAAALRAHGVDIDDPPPLRADF